MKTSHEHAHELINRMDEDQIRVITPILESFRSNYDAKDLYTVGICMEMPLASIKVLESVYYTLSYSHEPANEEEV